MTRQAAALDLLRYIGLHSVLPISGANALNNPTLITDDLLKAIVALNSANNDIFLEMPTNFCRKEMVATFQAPRPVTITVTQGSAAATLSSPLTDIMGCSIRISNDTFLNRIVGPTAGGSSVTLLFPYQGASGTTNAVIYGDACLLPQAVKTVDEPVEIRPNRLLSKAQDKTEFDRYFYQHNSRSYNYTMVEKTLGMPGIYFVDSVYDSTLEYVPLILRLNPIPPQYTSVSFVAELKPDHVVLSDIFDGTTGNDPNVKFSSISADWVDTFLLPVARQKFTTHPAFKNAEIKKSLAEQAASAVVKLRGTALSPNPAPTRARFI